MASTYKKALRTAKANNLDNHNAKKVARLAVQQERKDKK